MDFRSKKRRDLLALLLSITATTCSAPQDDRPTVAPDPPNVAMANPPNTAAETGPSPSVEAPPPTQLSVSFSYDASAEADLTGDGVPETLRLTASGPRPLGLGVSFSIWSEGQEIYRMSWNSAGYFKYEPELVMSEPGDSVLYAHVRDQLDPFFDSSAFMVVPPSALNADPSRPPFDPPDRNNDPVELISGQLLMPFLQDSLSAAGMDSTSALRQARSLA